MLLRATAAVLLLLFPAWIRAQSPTPPAPVRPAIASEVSARYFPLHPKPRNEAEKKIVDVLEDAHATQSRGMGNVSPEDGKLLRLLTETAGAKKVVEIGTSNGYSTLWFCLALRSTGGRLITHDLDPARIELARRNFARAGVNDIVTLVEGDAHQTTRKLKGPIDVLFLDAEKEGFVDYLTHLLPLVRPGGLILAHDSTGQAYLMDAYFKTIAANPALETVLVDASRWGLAVTRKIR